MLKECSPEGRNGNWYFCKDGGMGADYRQTFKTTIPALNACRSEGVDSIIATMWGDDGSEVSVNTTLLGIQLFAEYNYYTQVSFEHLKEKFRLCMELDAESFLAFEVDNLPEFYQKKLEKLNNVHDRNFEYLFDYYRELLKVLKEKAHIGIEIKRAYDNNDKAALEHMKDELAELKTDFETMQDKLAGEHCYSKITAAAALILTRLLFIVIIYFFLTTAIRT